MFNFLKQVPLFKGLSDEDLFILCEMTGEVHLSAGEILFTEGSTGDQAYVIQEGQIEIYKSVGKREVLLAVRGPGEVIGEMSLLDAVPRNASGRARSECKLVAITHEQLDRLLSSSSSAAITMLHTITDRLKSSELLLQQSEKMAQLGMLTAGIAHEINNPVAAVQRGAVQLKDLIYQVQQAQLRLGEFGLTGEQWVHLYNLYSEKKEKNAPKENLDLLEQSDKESELADWLEDLGVEEAWDIASALIGMGIILNDLVELEGHFSPEQLQYGLSWMAAQAEMDALLAEIYIGAGRIADIVKALKTYVYLDQGPTQRVDIHEGLENTLIILRSKLGRGIKITRDYGQDLPEIDAYGSELNQVWTNIISNASEAMGEEGELILRTGRKNGWVYVEIQDTGPGIPEDIQGKIFSPFFTTKPVGQGTGLGLNISYNIIQKHGGEIRVFSQPGKTCFQVILPTSQESAKHGPAPSAGNFGHEQPDG
jgi:signal transduction histidine kinase